MTNNHLWNIEWELDVVDWTCEETATWIEFIGYPQYRNLFLKYKIAGSILLQLTESDLTNYLFILNESDQINIMNMINMLK